MNAWFQATGSILPKSRPGQRSQPSLFTASLVAVLLLYLFAAAGCAALQRSRPQAGAESTQTQEILEAENQEDLEQLIQENINLRENVSRHEKHLEHLNSRLEQQKVDFVMIQKQWETNFVLLERSVGASLEKMEKQTAQRSAEFPILVAQVPESQNVAVKEVEPEPQQTEPKTKVPPPLEETYSLYDKVSEEEFEPLEDSEIIIDLEKDNVLPDDEEPGFIESVELRPEDLEDLEPLQEAPETVIQIAANLSENEKPQRQTIQPTVSKPEEPAYEDPDLSDPKNPVILIRHPGVKKIYNQGMTEVIQRKYKKAIRIFENFIQRFPDDMDSDNALYWVGHAYFQQKQTQKAESSFRRILTQYEHRPTSQGYKTPDAIYMLGRISELRGGIVAARYYYQEVSGRYPGSAAARSASRDLKRMP